jgi:PAS domain S-box-containing protein
MPLALRNVARARTSRRAPHSPSLQAPQVALVQPDPLQFAIGLDQLFQHARDALVIIEIASMRIRRWNAAAEELFGYSAAEAVGRSIEMVLPPAAARVHHERMDQYRRSGDRDMLIGRLAINMPVRGRDGAEIAAEMSVAPLEMPGCPTEWLLLTFRDARCRQQAELASAAAAHAESNRARSEAQLERYEELFIESASDLAKPIARVRRAARRLAAATASFSERPQRVVLLAAVVEARSSQVERTLAQISAAAAIHSGKFKLNEQRVNLVPLVSQLVATLRTRYPSHRLNFAAPQGLTAVCDADRISGLIEDLILRAVRRNPRGCWIDVDLRRPLAGLAQIEVRDYGRPPSRREREQFITPLAEDRAWFVNRHIVDLHHGTLALEFPREGGLRATLNLPTTRGRQSR